MVNKTVRNIPTEINLDQKEGLSVECVATFDNLQRIDKSVLTKRIGDLGLRYQEICQALQAFSDCPFAR